MIPLTDLELLDIWAALHCARYYGNGGTRHFLDLFPDKSELDSIWRVDHIRDKIEKYLEQKGHVIKKCTREQYEFEFETGRRQIFSVL